MLKRIAIILIFTVVFRFVNSQRICELQGSCFRCEHDRYSFYVCNVDSDCFPEEYCNAQRFCCPLAYVAPLANNFRHDEYYERSQPSDLGSANFELHFRPVASTSPTTVPQPSRCPDGASDWQRMCRADEDCLFRDEICANGKCCPSCERRRAQTLNHLHAHSDAAAQSPNLPRSKFDGFSQFERGASSRGEATVASVDTVADAWGGVYIPQCLDGDPRLYRAMQCANGTNDCFCVTRYGQRLRQTDDNTSDTVDCSAERAKLERHNFSVTDESNGNSTAALIQSLKDDLRRTTEKSRGHSAEIKEVDDQDAWTDEQDDAKSTTRNFADVLEIGGGALRRTPSRNSDSKDNDKSKTNTASACNDPLREWKLCGSACPISCATRTRAACAEDYCRRGCFCRLPYVILDASDPWHSRCVLPAECPMLAFTPAASDALNNFFASPSPRPRIRPQPRIGANRDGDFVSEAYYSPDNRPIMPVNRCSDPLKNFLTCGSACPQGCGRLSVDCAARCVVGCFCRVPYVLRDPEDVASECILPQHCVPKVTAPTQDYYALAKAECNARPNRQWHNCASKSRCTRSCSYLAATALSASSVEGRRAGATCTSIECLAGCDCAPSLVWSAGDECVKPENCPPTLRTFVVAGHDDEEESATFSTMPREFFTRAGSSSESDGEWEASTEPSEEEHSSTSVPPSTVDVRALETESCTRQPNKVYRSCASSCPLACDNDEPRWCTPCVSGCFCRNGFVFVNSSNWRESTCVRRSECTDIDAATKTTVFQPLSTASEDEDTNTTPSTTEIATTEPTISVISALPDECPQETVDLSGRACEHDFECGFQQKCCARRCKCVDPHAIWLECGTVCAEYCRLDNALAPPAACPKICRPGCYCASGYIRRAAGGGNGASECISVAKCLAWRAAASIQAHHVRYVNSHDDERMNVNVSQSTGDSAISSRDMSPSFLWSVRNGSPAAVASAERADAECGEALASGVLHVPSGARIGRVIVRPQRRAARREDDVATTLSDSLMRIVGELRLDVLRQLSGASAAQIYLSVHQFSDTTINGCQGIGEPLLLRLVDEDTNGFTVSTATTNIFIGRIPSDSDTPSTRVDRSFVWQDRIAPGTNPLIGHSIVLKAFRHTHSNAPALERTTIAEGTEATARPLACAILGIVPSC